MTGGGGILTLTVTNALNATGDWTGINDFDAFEIKDAGTFTSLTLAGATVTNDSLNANGCAVGNSTGGCFTFNTPLTVAASTFTNSMTFNISYVGTLDLSEPFLKVLFTTDGVKTGSLLSQVVPGNGVPVPEPASLLLLGAGLAGIGIWRRTVSKS